MKKYSDFIEWLSTCPVPYEVDDLTGFDDDSIVFFTSENTDKHEDDEEQIELRGRYAERTGPPLPMAGGSRPKLQASSGKLQATSVKLKTTLDKQQAA